MREVRSEQRLALWSVTTAWLLHLQVERLLLLQSVVDAVVELADLVAAERSRQGGCCYHVLEGIRECEGLCSVVSTCTYADTELSEGRELRLSLCQVRNAALVINSDGLLNGYCELELGLYSTSNTHLVLC